MYLIFALDAFVVETLVITLKISSSGESHEELLLSKGLFQLLRRKKIGFKYLGVVLNI